MVGHQKGFQDFIGRDQDIDDKNKTFNQFLFQVFKLDKEIKQILVKATNVIRDYKRDEIGPMERLEHVMAQDIVRGKTAKVDLTPSEKAIFEPVLRLLMYALCSLLEMSESIMATQMFTPKFKRMIARMRLHYRDDGDVPDRLSDEQEKIVDEGVKQVQSNLANL